MNPEQKLCPFCHNPIVDSYYFCPNCGKKLRSPPLSTSAISQIGVYALSIFLPPLGLWPGVKYRRQESKTAKIIGTIVIILTVVSTVVSTWFLIGFVNQINQSVGSQLNTYQNLGL
jgi:zinc-ribbon domain